MANECGQAISDIQYCQLGLLYYIGAGYLTFIISTALLSPLSLSSQMAIVYGQAISHIQYCQLGSLHYIGAGYLTFIISTALLSPLSLFPNGHCMWAGYLPHPILPAGLVALYRCRLSHLYNINSLAFSSLSLFPKGHCMWAGYLPHPIMPPGLVALHRCRLSHLCNTNCLAFSSLSPLLLEMANIGWYDQEIWQTKVNTVNPVISR